LSATPEWQTGGQERITCLEPEAQVTKVKLKKMGEKIKMPKRGVNWAFLKINARIKSY
jgi:hypothetical protein